jgi:hypothetical protein
LEGRYGGLAFRVIKEHFSREILTTLWKPGYLKKYRDWYRSETTSLKSNGLTGWKRWCAVAGKHTHTAGCYFFRCGIYDGLGDVTESMIVAPLQPHNNHGAASLFRFDTAFPCSLTCKNDDCYGFLANAII